MAKDRKKISRTRKIIGAIVMVVLMSIAFAFAQGTFRTFKIVSSSMEPAVQIGDCLLVNASRPVRPKRGDIVAVKNPDSPYEWLCKRVVALPHDKIKFFEGYTYVNDEKLPSVERFPWSQLMLIKPWYHLQELGDDEYYVMGDNVKKSHDSRYFGPVHDKDLIGIMTRIYWPPSRARSLKKQ